MVQDGFDEVRVWSGFEEIRLLDPKRQNEDRHDKETR